MSHQSSNRQQSSRSKSVKSQPTWQLPKTRLALPNSSDFEDKSADGQIHVTTEEFDSVKRGLTAAENRKLRETLLAFGERFCASRILDNKYANWRDIEVDMKQKCFVLAGIPQDCSHANLSAKVPIGNALRDLVRKPAL